MENIPDDSFASRTYLNENFWRFVEQHLSEDPTRLRLAAHTFKDSTFDIGLAILQIDGRQRYGKKLKSTLVSFPRFFFPDLLAGEQCSSDITAAFHARLIPEGNSLVDLTAGLGIDTLHMSVKTSTSTAIERRYRLAEILRWNAKGLGRDNLTVLDGDSLQLLDTLEGAETVFIDPARRAEDGSRVFGLSDCEPDVTELLPLLSKKFSRLVVKASPMLDIAQTIKDLPGVTDIYILGTNTECKELDAVVNLSQPDEDEKNVRIHAVTLGSDGSVSEFDFTRAEEADTPLPKTETPVKGHFLYVPSPAIMKASPIRLVSQRFDVEKIANNTHLYTSETLKDFPGEVFEIVEVIEWQSKYIKRLKSKYPRISVTTRNFGMSADSLRQKLGVKDGGDHRLFAVTTADDRRSMLICRSVSSSENKI